MSSPRSPGLPRGSGDPDAADWRLQVGRTRAAHPRRTLPCSVSVGRPAGPRVSTPVPWPTPRDYDAGLRFDVLDALLGQWAGLDTDDSSTPAGRPACCWLTRPGLPSLHDEDLAWYAAAAHAFSAHEVPLHRFRAITHTGWLDVVTGERTVWRRLRLRA